MSIAIAILGLALLILVHEAGHFYASLAVGLRPRRFYVGFPPPLVKMKRNGIEYCLGAIPLGGFVTIPGMHRPIGHDAERRFGPAVAEVAALTGGVDRVKRALDAEQFAAVPAMLDELEGGLGVSKLSPAARSSAEKGLTELRDALGSDAYWKAPTWKRLVAIGAGPAANIVLAIAIFTFLYATVAGQATSTVATVAPELREGVTSPAQSIGLQPGDRIVAVNGRVVGADGISTAIDGSAGAALTLIVARDGRKVELGPVSPQFVDGHYRLGLTLEGTSLPFVQAVGRAFKVTGILSLETVKSIGRLATGEGRHEVSSVLGITDASSQAVERGLDSYLWVLGLISLSVALLNLLPLLPLDGGHIVFSLIEGARGRSVQREIYERVSIVGLGVVLLLFFIGLTNDLGNLL